GGIGGIGKHGVIEDHLARGGREYPGHAMQECGFAGARWAHDGHGFAALISRVMPDRTGAPPKSLVTSSRCNMFAVLFSMLLISLGWRVKNHGASIALSGSAGTTLGCMWRKRKRHAKGTTHEQIQAEKIAELTKSRR